MSLDVVPGHPGIMEGLGREVGCLLDGALQTRTGGGVRRFATTWAAPQRNRAQWWRRRALGLTEGDATDDGARVGGGRIGLLFLPVWQ